MVTGWYHAYVTLEDLLDEHAPTHFPTLHFPMELSRRESLQDDMEYWHGLDWEKRIGTINGGSGELPIFRGGGSRTLDVSTIEHDYYSSDDNYGMNEYGMNGTPIRNGNSFVVSLGGITHSVREDGFVDYGVKNVIDTRGGGNAED